MSSPSCPLCSSVLPLVLPDTDETNDAVDKHAIQVPKGTLKPTSSSPPSPHEGKAEGVSRALITITRESEDDSDAGFRRGHREVRSPEQEKLDAVVSQPPLRLGAALLLLSAPFSSVAGKRPSFSRLFYSGTWSSRPHDVGSEPAHSWSVGAQDEVPRAHYGTRDRRGKGSDAQISRAI